MAGAQADEVALVSAPGNVVLCDTCLSSLPGKHIHLHYHVRERGEWRAAGNLDFCSWMCVSLWVQDKVDAPDPVAVDLGAGRDVVERG